MRKYFIAVKTGLSQDPRHQKRMGNRIWLFLFIVDHVDWETGRIDSWTDEWAASEMDMSKATIKQQRQELQTLGYITCQQLKRWQRITVHNWQNPRSATREIINKKPVFGDEYKRNPPNMAQAAVVKGDGITSPLAEEAKGEVKGEVKGIGKYPPLPIKDQIDHIDHTLSGFEVWDAIVPYLEAKFNGSYARLNPRLHSVDDPRILTVFVNEADRYIKGSIGKLAKMVSGEKWDVTVTVNPPIVCGSTLLPVQQQINALSQRIDQLAGAVQWVDGEDKEALTYLAEKDITPDQLEQIYHIVYQNSPKFWATRRIGPKTIAKNISLLNGGKNVRPTTDTRTGADKTSEADLRAVAAEINAARAARKS